MKDPSPDRALLVDLYELTMAAYSEHHVEGRATFELFVRQLPAERSYLVAAGVRLVTVADICQIT
jgi:nicotinate phosphoribosyltransferase